MEVIIMETREYGYIRVSSKDQNEARQIDSLLSEGINKRDIYIDKQSGKDFNRPEWQLLKGNLRKGDTLFVHSLDRLGRNKEGILNEWNDITKNICADIVVLDMPLLDTRKHKDSIGTFIADLVLQVLSWIAEDERTRIKTRQTEGIESAMKRGTKFGRPKKSYDSMSDVEREEFIQHYNEWKQGNKTAVQTFTELDMTKTTFYKIVKEYEETLKPI